MNETMIVRVRAFAGLRDVLGAGSFEVELPAGADVAVLLARLDTDHPHARLPDKHFSVAVNRQYSDHARVLQSGDEVALIPPVSGGSGLGSGDSAPVSGDYIKLFEITSAPISLDEAVRRIGAPDRGGVALFAGTVRGVTGDLTTDYLEYEAYAEMAEPALAAIAAEAQRRWPEVSAVCVIHRVGRLDVGDVAVVVAVAASHRRHTFDACSFIIDRIKQDAPIWKKEVGGNGEIWVEGPESTV